MRAINYAFDLKVKGGAKMVKARNVLRHILIPIAFLLNNQRRHQPVKSVKKYFFLMKGFMHESMILYGLTISNYHEYLSDIQILKTGAINQEAAQYLNNKVVFVDKLTGLIELPKTLATIHDGTFISRIEDFQDSTSLVAFLENKPEIKLVIKPIDGAEGRGVSVISCENGVIKRNSDQISKEDFQDYLADLDEYFISEFIQQGQFAQALFPDSLNTIRILTMIDPNTQKAFIGGMVFRVGTRLSAPTDNFRRRGLSLAIDPFTGHLGKAATLPDRGKVHWFERHPNTGKQLTGQKIPHWQTIQTKILAVANYVFENHEVKYVGWDVVLTDEGMSLLEGNSRPGVSLLQVHQPLLSNPQTKAFYEHHHIL